mgnify:CR=1 FL=1
MILDIEDRLVFQVLINKIAPVLDNYLPQGVFNDRVSKSKNRLFISWYENWPKYQKKLIQTYDEGYKTLITTDISNYFDSINHNILKELLMQDAKKIKKPILNLLFFILEFWTSRDMYETNSYTGIPQGNDASRFLGNIYLVNIDKHMSILDGIKYYRWMDDINIFINEKANPKVTLRKLDMYMRSIQLNINMSKTLVLEGREIKDYFYVTENDFVGSLIKDLSSRKVKAQDIKENLIERFDNFLKIDKKSSIWEKVYKRYYTVFTKIKFNRLDELIIKDIVNRPRLIEKICKYILYCSPTPEMVDLIIEYLKSEKDNIYQDVEIQLISLLLIIPMPKDKIVVIKKFAASHFLKIKNYWYVRCLSLLLICKFGTQSDLKEIEKRYDSDNKKNPLILKYLIITTFLKKDNSKTMDKIKFESDPSIIRFSILLNFIGTIKKLENSILDRLNIHGFYDYKYITIQQFILLKILSNNESLHNELKIIIKRFLKKNDDSVMDVKLRNLLNDLE